MLLAKLYMNVSYNENSTLEITVNILINSIAQTRQLIPVAGQTLHQKKNYHEVYISIILQRTRPSEHLPTMHNES